MIRPANFFSNPDTLKDNSFQIFNLQDLTLQAQQEFDAAVELLTAAGIKVTVIQDTELPVTPDSVFPNNRLSFHSGGKVVIYPMMAANRRQERELETLSVLEKNGSIKIQSRIDFSGYESEHMFLEGTGSMILDRKNKIVYVAKSKRSDVELVDLFCNEMGYQSVVFDAGLELELQGETIFSPIYHTNVMLAIAEDFVVIADSVIEQKQRQKVLDCLANTGREILKISTLQMQKFCGNILQLKSQLGKKIIVMSKTANDNFTQQQLDIIQQNNIVVITDIAVIEAASGGSIRCMIAEIF